MTGAVAGKGAVTTVTWLEQHLNHGAKEAYHSGPCTGVVPS